MRSRFGCAFFIYIVLIYTRVAVWLRVFYLEISALVVACRNLTKFRSPLFVPLVYRLVAVLVVEFRKMIGLHLSFQHDPSRVGSFFPLGSRARGKNVTGSESKTPPILSDAGDKIGV